MANKSDLVLDYLIKENCPCSLIEIIEKSGQSLGKANVQKILDKLVSQNKLRAKTVGKHTLYTASQTIDLNEHKRNMQNLRTRLGQSQQLVKSLQSECRELETKAKSALNLRSIQSLEEERGRLLDDIRGLNENLRQFSRSIAEGHLSEIVAKEIEKSFEANATAYRKRKNISMEMLDAILEGYPKKKMALIEDIGIETDEAENFNVNILN